jgi:DNA polymerase-3 subunit delta
MPVLHGRTADIDIAFAALAPARQAPKLLGVAAKSKSTPTAARRFFAVIGSDEGMVREQALELYNQLTGGLDDGFTHEIIDGIADNSDSAHEICASVVQALQTLPMFGGDKVVWLRNANFLGDNITGRSQRTEAGVEGLRAVLEAGLPDGVQFLLTAQGVDKRRAFWKFIEKSADVRVCDRIDTSRDGWQGEVADIVSSRATALGLDFEPEALEIFILQAGEQTRQIGNELEKLDLFLGPDRRTITRADVDLLVPLSRAAVVFEIGRAIQNGNAARAIQLIDEQLAADDKAAIGIIRAAIITTVRNMYFAKLICENFNPPVGSYQAFSAALNRLPENDRAWMPQKKDRSGLNVFPLFQCVAATKHYELPALQGVLEATLKADEALVTTGLDSRLILHRLVVQIAAARK